MTPDEFVAVVVADAVVASLCPMGDVIDVPCAVDSPTKTFEELGTLKHGNNNP